MGQDLRKLFKEEEKEAQYKMKEGHEERFSKLLDAQLPQAKTAPFFFLKIAASIVLMISIGIYGYVQFTKEDELQNPVVVKENPKEETTNISLGDLSPDLEKVENYYVANINLELSQLQVSDENKALVDSFMKRLVELNNEYGKLNSELNEVGPNDQTINALIKNLQLRLQLLHQLKEKLNELKTSRNEQVTA